jgi:hypothetical protein
MSDWSADDAQCESVRVSYYAWEERMKSMYVTKRGSFVELRQTRYREQLLADNEHPHDVCAIARDTKEMHDMADKHWQDIDYSEVE